MEEKPPTPSTSAVTTEGAPYVDPDLCRLRGREADPQLLDLPARPDCNPCAPIVHAKAGKCIQELMWYIVAK